MTMTDSAVKTALSEFAVDLYAKVLACQKDDLENTFLSPVSIYTALATTMVGAGGETLRQMQHTLCIPGSLGDAELHNSVGSIVRKCFTGSDNLDLSLANRLFLIHSAAIERQFSNTVSKCYGADAEVLSSFPDLEAKRKHINAWVATNTKDKINELIPSGALQQSTTLAIVNALYFRGSWEYAFCKEATMEREFHCLNGSSRKVPMMYKDVTCPFVELHEEEAVAVKLPFKGGEWELLVVLPNEKDGLRKLARSLMLPGNLSSILRAKFEPTKIDLHLPRFKLSHTNPLNVIKLLEQCGLRALFDADSADLSHLCSSQKLYVSEVWHKAVLEVDEEGATAAAATGFGIAKYCLMLKPVVCVDHPFLVVVLNEQTTPVFVGHVTDPEE
ncbi:unnamed protein product [Dicrocoelium dendriticum]|nr:unnamed protein product [Dicrocoelium dendriticum]